MRASVRAAFLWYTVPLEGWTDWLYCDVLGLVTTSIGVLVDPVGLVDALPFRHPDGSPATKAEVRGAWHAVKERQDLRLRGGGSYRGLTSIRLAPEGVERVAFRKLEDMVERLRKRFPAWAEWPADAQLAIASLAWACGPAFRYPRLERSLRAGDFVAASKESDIRPDHGTIKERNTAQRLCLLNAADVVAKGLDRDVLHFPSRVPATALHAGGGMLAIEGIAEGLRDG